jgi:small-conductance mechanosensitive channel
MPMGTPLRPVLALGTSLGVFLACAAAAQPAPPRSIAAAIAAEPAGQSATVTFFNRSIVVLRARVLGREPAERVVAAERVLHDLADRQIVGPVDWHSFDGGAIVSVESRTVIALTTPDIDELSGETIPGVAAETVARLRQALGEAAEARAPAVLLREGALAALGLAVGLAILYGIGRARRVLTARAVHIAKRTLASSGLADLEALRASRLLDFERWLITSITAAAHLIVIYATVTFVLRRFPYTRPWGESMRSFLVSTAQQLGLGILDAIPGLFTAALIFVIARFLIRLVGLWFAAVERGRITPRWIYPETAVPTRRLLSALVWLFAVVVAYPYLPGSQTEAFKGVSVFLGLMVTFGSSGLVNQIMSGFMVTYSRAVRVGDFVRVGEVDGTVTHLGVLSVKVKTLLNEDVTLPNAVVVSQTITDYTRSGDTEGVFTPTSVTIGYDTPWRQVHALLLEAAARTPGLRREPKPVVFQAALEDFYVKYTLWVSLVRQQSRLVTLDTLHANIQDLFNQYGVQIMSPNYMVDPAAPKIVAKKDWFAAPAAAGAPLGADVERT